MLDQQMQQQQRVTVYSVHVPGPGLATTEPVSDLFRLTLQVKSEGTGEIIARHSSALSRRPGTYSKACKQISCQLARTDAPHRTPHSMKGWREESNVRRRRRRKNMDGGAWLIPTRPSHDNNDQGALTESPCGLRRTWQQWHGMNV
ncbi:hypothetical protein JOB18_025536 [Solea senegalensis]|uniref:Uncharacterized protein n=1 Tax=Solea senegalensis TaxID=28829 RepID=A0AAV6QG11_SOLSE|nr:hypothetical protein JOB18_025536 [Solea senegalensis]